MDDHNLILHLIELRKRFIFILIGFFIVFAILFHFDNLIFDYLAKPLFAYLPKTSNLVATDIIAPFFTPLKLSIILAIFISLPNTFIQIWAFIAPALYLHEKKIGAYCVIIAILLFAIGISFCYFLVLPILFKFINSVASPNITIMADITKYLDLILNLFLIFGICFETPLIIYLLIHFKILPINTLKKARPYIFVASFIIAAILAPPDILSQILLAIPLYLLYEVGIFFAWLEELREC